MAAVERIIKRVKESKVSAAVEGLARPQTRDAFELGRLCGIQQGLAIAEKIVEEEISQDEQSGTQTGESERTRRR
jgi:hypothetical protein